MNGLIRELIVILLYFGAAWLLSAVFHTAMTDVVAHLALMAIAIHTARHPR